MGMITEATLERSGIGGIYDEFTSLKDAIEQMTSYIKELESYKNRLEIRNQIAEEAAEIDAAKWHGDAERLAEALMAFRKDHDRDIRDLRDEVGSGFAEPCDCGLCKQACAALVAHDTLTKGDE
jgi:hypothetical protein